MTAMLAPVAPDGMVHDDCTPTGTTTVCGRLIDAPGWRYERIAESDPRPPCPTCFPTE